MGPVLSVSSEFLPAFDSSVPHSGAAADYIAYHRARSRQPLGLVNRDIFPRGEGFPEFSRVSADATIEVYRRDAVVHRKVVGLQTKHGGGGSRGRIRELSRKSVRRMKLAFRNMDDPVTSITLTYPADYPNDGLTVKRHLEAFREAWRRKYPNEPDIAWILEFQLRGAAHYHIWAWRYATPQMREWISETWYRIVGSGDEKHLRAGTQCVPCRKPHAAASYAAKYASKYEQKEVPEGYSNVGRFWGLSRGKQPRARVILDWTTGPDVFQAIRALRKLYNARRLRWGKLPIRDNGRYSVTFWGCGFDPGGR
jgi:hypothetical protein